MNFTKHEQDRLIRAFRRIHHDRTPPALDDNWQKHTMNIIRALPSGAKQKNGFSELVWKISPATAVLLVALSFFMLSSGYNPFTQSVDLFTDYALSYSYEQIFSGY